MHLNIYRYITHTLELYALGVCCLYGILKSDKIVTQWRMNMKAKSFVLFSGFRCSVHCTAPPPTTKMFLTFTQQFMWFHLTFFQPLPSRRRRVLNVGIFVWLMLLSFWQPWLSIWPELQIKYCDQHIDLCHPSHNITKSNRLSFVCAFQFCLWNINISPNLINMDQWTTRFTNGQRGKNCMQRKTHRHIHLNRTIINLNKSLMLCTP